jgi:hypothetical protein
MARTTISPAKRPRIAWTEDRLEAAGWSVIRFHHAADWAARLDAYPRVFGVAPAAAPPPPPPPAPAIVPPLPPSTSTCSSPRGTRRCRPWRPRASTIAGGEEVMQGGRVIDQYLASLSRGDRTVRLVDLDAPAAAKVARALEAQGERVLRARASMPDLVARVDAALAEPGG